MDSHSLVLPISESGKRRSLRAHSAADVGVSVLILGGFVFTSVMSAKMIALARMVNTFLAWSLPFVFFVLFSVLWAGLFGAVWIARQTRLRDFRRLSGMLTVNPSSISFGNYQIPRDSVTTADKTPRFIHIRYIENGKAWRLRVPLSLLPAGSAEHVLAAIGSPSLRTPVAPPRVGPLRTVAMAVATVACLLLWHVYVASSLPGSEAARGLYSHHQRTGWLNIELALSSVAMGVFIGRSVSLEWPVTRILAWIFVGASLCTAALVGIGSLPLWPFFKISLPSDWPASPTQVGRTVLFLFGFLGYMIGASCVIVWIGRNELSENLRPPIYRPRR